MNEYQIGKDIGDVLARLKAVEDKLAHRPCACGERKKSGAQDYLEHVPQKYLALMIGGQCEEECDPPLERGGEIWCEWHNTRCAQLGCECRLFRLRKKNPEKWEKLPKDKNPYEPDDYFYRCWCVTRDAPPAG